MTFFTKKQIKSQSEQKTKIAHTYRTTTTLFFRQCIITQESSSRFDVLFNRVTVSYFIYYSCTAGFTILRSEVGDCPYIYIPRTQDSRTKGRKLLPNGLPHGSPGPSRPSFFQCRFLDLFSMYFGWISASIFLQIKCFQPFQVTILVWIA